MKRPGKRNAGSSLIEVVISLAVLGIVSLPLMLGFLNSAAVMKLSSERLEINAVTRIIKENVIRSVKYGVGNKIPSYDPDFADGVDLQSEKNGYDLMIVDMLGKTYGKYKFDAERIKDFGTIEEFENTCEYLITIKKIDGNLVQKLKILVNSLDP